MARTFRPSEYSGPNSILNIIPTKDPGKLCSQWTAEVTKWSNAKTIPLVRTKVTIEKKLAEAVAERDRNCANAKKAEALKDSLIAGSIPSTSTSPTYAPSTTSYDVPVAEDTGMGMGTTIALSLGGLALLGGLGLWLRGRRR